MSDQNQELSRRDLLRNLGVSIALTSTGLNVLPAGAAQQAHQAVTAERVAKGAYTPKCFTAHEYQTLSKLAGLILPPDEHSKGAVEAGAPEFIDFLASRNEELAAIYTGGIAWLDNEMKRRYHTNFVEAAPDQQAALLDLIAYRKNDSPELGPGIHFFAWARNMVVDAFYTSPIGIKDLGYIGNTAISQFSVPAEAVQYALKRSGL